LIDEFIASYSQTSSNLFSPEEWKYLCDRVKYHSKTGALRDLWRDVFDPKDPPAKVPPFKIQLKPDAVPYIAKGRKYNEEELRFLKLWNEKLIADGIGYINNNSRWASRVLPVKKRDEDPTHASENKNRKFSKYLKSDESF
jgi:hypothetical protein